MSRIRVCPSPIKNKPHWDILSEPTYTSLSEKWNQPNVTNQVNADAESLELCLHMRHVT